MLFFPAGYKLYKNYKKKLKIIFKCSSALINYRSKHFNNKKGNLIEVFNFCPIVTMLLKLAVIIFTIPITLEFVSKIEIFLFYEDYVNWFKKPNVKYNFFILIVYDKNLQKTILAIYHFKN